MNPEIHGPPSPPRKRKTAVIVEHGADVTAAARDVAERRLQNGKEEARGFGLSAIKKRIWDYGLAGRINLGRETGRAKNEIISQKNIFALEESLGEREKEKANRKRRQALIERFSSEYEEAIHAEAGEERRVNEEAGVSSSEIKALISRFALDEIDEDNFIEARNRIVGRAVTQRDSDNSSKFARAEVYHTDNLLEIAKEIKAASSHREGVEALVADLDIVIGRAKTGARTEAHLDAIDRIVEKIQTTKLGLLFNETTLSTIVAGALMAAERVGRSRIAAYGTFGASALVGGLILGVREKARLKAERAQNMRERAQGREIEPGSGRREEMEQYRYQTEPARDLINRLAVDGVDWTNREESARVWQALMDVEARIKLSDRHKIDLISYSAIENIEQERLNLDIARAKAKAAMRAAARRPGSLPFLRLENPDDFDAVLRDGAVRAGWDLTEGDVEQKDRLFDKMRRRKVIKATAWGTGIGFLAGLGAQEVGAAIFHNEQGLWQGTGRGTYEKLPQSTTALEGLKLWISGLLTGEHYGGQMPPLHAVALPGVHGSVKIPEGLSLVPDPNAHLPSGRHVYDLVRADGSRVTGGIEFTHDGSLTHASQELLKKGGLHLQEVVHHISTTKAEEVTRNATQYIGAHRGDFHHIHREFWMDQNSPYHAIKNALKLWWGGEHNTGVDANGNYVFNVSHMTHHGSYHGTHALDAKDAITNRRLKLALSLSDGTQAHVVEVPIDAHGNAIIDPHSKIGSVFFYHDAEGHAVFKGRFAEVIVGEGTRPDGSQNVIPLATFEGHGVGNIHNTIEVPSTTDVPTTTILPPDQQYFIAPPPVIPIWGRGPMEKMERPYQYNTYEYGYEGGPLKYDRQMMSAYRNLHDEQSRAALQQHFEEDLETNPDPAFREKYGFVLQYLRNLEAWDLVPSDRRRQINEHLCLIYQIKADDLNEDTAARLRQIERDRMYRMIENILIEESKIGYKPFPNEFYESAPLINGLKRADEVVVILDDPIGDAVISTPAILALDAYFKQNNIHKPTKVITRNGALLESLKDQFPEVTLVDPAESERAFPTEQRYGQRYIINMNKSFENYASIGVPKTVADSWKDRGATDPSCVLSVDWSSWMKEEVPNGPRLIKYDPIPARILRGIEIMTGQRLFEDINGMQAYLEKRKDFPEQERLIRNKYHVAPNEKVIVVSAGSAARPKEYMPEKWSELLTEIFKKHADAHVLFLQDPADETRRRYEPIIDELINKEHYRISKVSETPSYLNTIMAMADLAITPDTGLGHLAAAVGTPNVVIGIIGDPVQWSAAKTYRVMHPQALRQYATGGGVYGPLYDPRWSDKYFVITENGERVGASDVPVNQVYEAVKKALSA
ncbi:MAG: glycosyltransferase family 9 protein [Minisyncoccia bacterium]